MKEITIHAPDKLMFSTVSEFRDHARHVINMERPDRLVIDLSNTSFLDSGGVGVLALTYKLAAQNSVEMVITNPRPLIARVLKITKLDTLSLHPQKVEDLPKHLPTHPSINSKTKRAMDIVGSLVGLAIASVVFVPIAIAIKMESSGPILFKQVRRGWMGVPFNLWKFRSMSADAELRKSEVLNEAAGAFFKSKSDPRITKVGKVLRRTSLDELPQFWNVLRGEMSLVGTRPPTPNEVDQYDVPEWRRLNVKPGITGEWQTSGRSNITDFNEVIRLDLKYQHEWSIWRDVILLLKTIKIVFTKDSGAV